jgi:hypothetical protein
MERFHNDNATTVDPCIGSNNSSIVTLTEVSTVTTKGSLSSNARTNRRRDILAKSVFRRPPPESSLAPNVIEGRSPTLTVKERSPTLTAKERSPTLTAEERSLTLTVEERSPTLTAKERSLALTSEERSREIAAEGNSRVLAEI